MSVDTLAVERLFWANIEKIDWGECWLWQGAVGNHGYGLLGGGKGQVLAHRFSYGLLVEPPPNGMKMVLDHFCHTLDKTCKGGSTCQHRRCVNPNHMELVTRGENVRRGVGSNKGSFICGHPYKLSNMYIRKLSGYKFCKTCHIEREIARKTNNNGKVIPRVDNRYLVNQVVVIKKKKNSSEVIIERIFERIKIVNKCWIWTGGIEGHGYGMVWFNGRNYKTHRLLYKLIVSDIEQDLVLDHRCHNDDPTCTDWKTCPHRACVNPFHLDPVTNRVNILRGNGVAAVNSKKTHCSRGHEFSGDNLKIRKANKYHPNGRRDCKTCYDEKAKRYKDNNLEKIRKYDREYKMAKRDEINPDRIKNLERRTV